MDRSLKVKLTIGALAVVVVLLGNSLGNRLKQHIAPLPPRVEQKAEVPPGAEQDDSLPPRLKGAAQRLWSGYQVYESKSKVPWKDLEPNRAWTEEEASDLKAVAKLIVAFGDPTAAEALPEGKNPKFEKFMPLGASIGYKVGSGHVAMVNAVIDPEKKLLLVNPNLLRQAFGGMLYHVHAALISTPGENGESRDAEQIAQRQVAFVRRLIASLRVHSNKQFREFVLEELELLCPAAFDK